MERGLSANEVPSFSIMSTAAWEVKGEGPLSAGQRRIRHYIVAGDNDDGVGALPEGYDRSIFLCPLLELKESAESP